MTTPFVFGLALGTIDHVYVGVAFLGLAFTRGLYEPLLADAMNRQIESERRATALSVKSLFTNILMVIAWPLAGIAVDGAGLQAVFLAYACGALGLGGLMWWRWDRARPGPRRAVAGSGRRSR